jgi:hypothetical protein
MSSFKVIDRNTSSLGMIEKRVEFLKINDEVSIDLNDRRLSHTNFHMGMSPPMLMTVHCA